MPDFTIEIMQQCSNSSLTIDEDLANPGKFCNWHELHGKGQTPEQKDQMVCPDCGELTDYVKVAV